jgi:hypothetical protein
MDIKIKVAKSFYMAKTLALNPNPKNKPKIPLHPKP